ncbi:unnamed protein product, partial [Iphiclides podalirius]
MAIHLKIVIIFSAWFLNEEVRSASRYRRLSLAEPSPNYYFDHVQGYPGTYTFGYDVTDPGTGNVQYRKEERFPNGTVMGTYGYLDPFGRIRRYKYVANEDGYRVYNVPQTAEIVQIFNGQKASTESSVTWTRPGKSKKKKTQEEKPVFLNGFKNDNKYFNLKPPSYYAID